MAYTSPARRRAPRPSLQEADDAYERRIIPFDPAARRRVSSEAYDAPYRTLPARQDAAPERRAAVSRPVRVPVGDQALPTQDRRAHRRRRPSTWLQRNALYVAAGGFLCGMVGVAFGVIQVLHFGAPPQAGNASASAAVAQTQPASGQPAASAQPDQLDMSALQAPTAARPQEITTTVRAIEPNYTVASGDTLVAIAQRFGTTVARIQALNQLPDPRVLNVGQKLVIPPAL